MNAASLSPGFADAVHDSQRAFRAALDAMARPARLMPLGQPVPGLALGAAMSHLLLALTDEDTPVWWQQADASLRQWLRFHTGARVARTHAEASFAVITDASELPELSRFAAGTLAEPEHSCTLLVEVSSLDNGPVLHAQGPGIRERTPIAVGGLPEGFWAEWQASHASFPQGVDIFFTCGGTVLGLPRTTRISRLQEV